jgi:ribose 5-phosphate isomerase B
MRIALSADHAGVDLKDLLAEWLAEQGHDILDLGTHGHESVDYPRFGAMLAEAVTDGRAERGITVCGSGIGVAIAANRNPECRCAQVAEPLSAQLARQHNNANAIALGARIIGVEMAKACVTTFLTTDFLGGRHERRVEQLSALDAQTQDQN